MRHRIVHRCRYAFETPVSQCRVITRLRPRTLPHQAVESHLLIVRPLAAKRIAFKDGFENHCIQIDVDGPTGIMDLTASSIVGLVHCEQPTLGMDWRLCVEESRPIQGSKRVPHLPDIARYAAQSFEARLPIGAALVDLFARLRSDFVFDASSTTVDTDLTVFWRDRRGTCQDFTHLTLSCLRSLGFAARYTSGYVLPAKGTIAQPHAWVALWIPGLGFWDVDPTHGQLATQHITLAWGHDYDDAASLTGIAKGAGATRLETDIQIYAL